MKLSEILENLQQPIPQQLISQKKAKNHKTGQVSFIDYVAWFDLADLLDQRCGLGGWEWKFIDQQQVGNRLTQVWELTLIGEDGKLTRAAAGDEDVDVNSFGSPATNGEAQCLRRCCSKFGLGRDLWRKEKTEPKPQLPPIPVPTLKAGEIPREEWLRRKQLNR